MKAMLLTPRRTALALALGLCPWALPARSIEPADIEFLPDRSDSFDYAAFRLRWPASNGPLRATVVLLPGSDGDGRPATTDRRWTQWADEQGAALIGGFIRADSYPYSEAGEGAGQAIFRAIDRWTTELHRPDLANAPLFLFGHSAGGQLSLSTAVWCPERVAGVVAAKWARVPDFDPGTLCPVPTTIVIGELDTSRHASMSLAYAAFRFRNSPWSLAVESGAHEEGQAGRWARLFFSALASSPPVSPWQGTLSDRSVRPIDSESQSDAPVPPRPDSIWLPNESLAREWAAWVKPVELNALLTKPHSVCAPDTFTLHGPRLLEMPASAGAVMSIPIHYTEQSGQRPWDRIAWSLRETNCTWDLPVSWKDEFPATGTLRVLPDAPDPPAGLQFLQLRGELWNGVQRLGVETLSLRVRFTNELSVAPSLILMPSLRRGERATSTVHLTGPDLRWGHAAWSGNAVHQVEPNQAEPANDRLPVTIHWHHDGSFFGNVRGVLSFNVATALATNRTVSVPFIGRLDRR